jgi:hypothetical protein
MAIGAPHAGCPHAFLLLQLLQEWWAMLASYATCGDAARAEHSQALVAPVGQPHHCMTWQRSALHRRTALLDLLLRLSIMVVSISPWCSP